MTSLGARVTLLPGDAANLPFDDAAGLAEVTVTAIDTPARFDSFDDYWLPFLGGQGPAPAYAMSLAEGDRVRLRQSLRDSLVTAADGSLTLMARAWAVRGTKRAAAPG